MTSVQHHVVTTQSHSSSGTHLDNHLDALLDDLQTTVSRPGTSLALSTQNGGSMMMNGTSFGGQINLPPGASGYREVTTTVTRDTNGVPMTSREYQIEYLNPANTVTVLDDRSSSPAMELFKGGDLAGHQIQSYKTEVYDYKYSKTTSDKKTLGYGGNQRAIEDSKSHLTESKSYHQDKPQVQDNSHFAKMEKSERTETNVGKNLNELDMLLKELNTSSPNAIPGDSRSTSKREHTIETRVEGRYGDPSSTMSKRPSSATREVTFTEKSQNRLNRGQSPTTPTGSMSKSPGRTINVRHEYNTMESSGHTSRRDSPSTRNRSAEMSPTLRRRTPSPSSGEFRPSNFSNYPINPRDLTPTRTVTKSYNYSTSSRRTPTPTTFDEPQPYRSPSPVSFPQKRSPSPNRRSLNRSDSGRNVSYQVSSQATENPTVISYKYASHSSKQSRYPGGGNEDRDESFSRPFPSSAPAPVGEQNPPKKLDELMASFQDSKVRSPQSGEYNSQGEYTHKIEMHDGGLQRSPSFERNLRPSNVKVSQTYSQQQQQHHQNQGHEYQTQYQQSQYQQREQQRHHQQQQQQQQPQPASFHKEIRREEYHTREHYPGQYHQQPPQQHPPQQQQREQYQQSQYQQYQQSQGGYQRENREQYQQSHGQYQQNQHQYQQNQQYQYQQHQQYQQQSSQKPVNESMSSSQGYRTASASRSVAGPPVYYPPGVELFTKKEEAMLNQEQTGGKKKSKGKSKSDKGKGKGVSGVPMCLPVCCAMPCSIM